MRMIIKKGKHKSESGTVNTKGGAMGAACPRGWVCFSSLILLRNASSWWYFFFLEVIMESQEVTKKCTGPVYFSPFAL